MSIFKQFISVSLRKKKFKRYLFVLCMYALLQRIPVIYCKSKKLLSHNSTLFPKGTVGQIQSTSNRAVFRTFSIEPGMGKTSRVSAESSREKNP